MPSLTPNTYSASVTAPMSTTIAAPAIAAARCQVPCAERAHAIDERLASNNASDALGVIGGRPTASRSSGWL